MAKLAKEVKNINIEKELQQSYLDYAMSVIVGRALPDVRDGLKPVHRRILYAMQELGLEWNKSYKKSARIVGDVIGKYHPHGDTAVYDSLVRMAQPFSMRYLLIDGQGNFGSIDGDSPAAMRYTETRMTKIASYLLADLDKETVDFIPNYDELELQPTVLPTKLPNLLVNGSSGIAVGMATNIPPHNLQEVINGCIAMIDNPNISIDELMQYIPGPDFPTHGIINGKDGIVSAYNTGRGTIYVRARFNIEEEEKSNKIIINELPFQVNKSHLIEKIAELVKDKKIDGISTLRDESDKDGIRIIIELKKGEIANVIINNLYAQTQLQTSFSINLVALVNNQPLLLNLYQILDCFIKHRRQVVYRRTIYEIRKARERAHILEGLIVALTHIDKIINLIKSAKTLKEAKENLICNGFSSEKIENVLNITNLSNVRPKDLENIYGLIDNNYYLSPKQAQAILDLRLHRLIKLEQNKIIKELKLIIDNIKIYSNILNNNQYLMQVIRDELQVLKSEFNDIRRTEIINNQKNVSIEDLITPENMVITLSHRGYIKSQSLTTYKTQCRGGRGKIAATVKDKDFIAMLKIANTHDILLCFSNKGKVYWLKMYKIPFGNRLSKGKPIVNLLPLQNNEYISAILPIRKYEADKAILMTTSYGTIKKVLLTEFQRSRSNGIFAIDLEIGDYLIDAKLTNIDGTNEVLLVSNIGKIIRFACSNIRCTGRFAKGVRGIKLKKTQYVVSSIILDLDVKQNSTILLTTHNGYGKRTVIKSFPIVRRGGQGVIGIQMSKRNGIVVDAIQVWNNEELMLISDQGTLVRTRTKEISIMGRNTQGVRLINLSDKEYLVGAQRII